MPIILFLFIAMPILEIAVLIKVGAAIGLPLTLAIIIITAILGTFLLRQQGLSTLNRARNRLASGQLPAEQMMEGILLVVGGVLLLTPGFVTDAFGLFCLFPLTRQWLAGRIAARSFIFAAGGNVTSGPSHSSTSNTTHTTERPQQSDVIEGTYHRTDEDK